MPPAWITTTGDYKIWQSSIIHTSINLNGSCRNNHLFWADVYRDRVFIWRSNLDDGSDAIPLIDTGVSPTQYGKALTYRHITSDSERLNFYF